MHLIHGNAEQEDDAGQPAGIAELPPPGFAVLAGAVHLVEHREPGAPTRGACGAFLRRAELHHREPPGRRCRGCFGDQAVAVAVRRP